MTEAVFPLLGAAFIVLIVLPLFALIAKGVLVLLERHAVGGALHGLNLRYIVLTASSALPLAWFFSAGLHQAETGQSTLGCLLDHGNAALCFEPGFFALMLAAGVAIAWRRAVRGYGDVTPSSSRGAADLARRIEAIIETRIELAGLLDRIVLTDDPSFSLGTRGIFRPRTFLGVRFGQDLTDAMLAGALAHEREHLRSFDPLRYLLLELVLGVNPFGRFLLKPHVARWKASREAHCDREAVLRGAAPLALADAIVRAARPTMREAVALGARDTLILELRVRMLLAFAERAPHRCCNGGSSAIPFAVLIVVLALLLPHETGTQPLDVLHTGTEQALTYLLR